MRSHRATRTRAASRLRCYAAAGWNQWLLCVRPHGRTTACAELEQAGAIAVEGKGGRRTNGAGLSWLLRGCADFIVHGLGPVQTAARSDRGVEAWWDARISEGRIKPGKGWTALDAFASDLGDFLAPSGDEPPRANDLAGFLRTRIEFKRTKEARLYRALVTPGDASNQPPYTRIESCPEASPAVTTCPEGGI